MILNQAQAEAVYSAMCALNNVGAKVKAMFGDVSTSGINVLEESSGSVRVVRVHQYDVQEAEDYADQADFATAYGLNGDEWQSDVAAAAGGLTQTAIEH